MKKVKLFDNCTGDTTKDVNDYLETLKMPSKLVKIQSHYNTIMGGITYVVIHE